MTTGSPITRRCPGMRDLSPADMARFHRIAEVFRGVVAAWGYGEVRTPTIEYLHLFTGAGTLSPQMLGRVYSFLDWDGWSGERVVLRPDATIPAARLYTERFTPGEDARLSYVQNVLRFADGDDSREDWQCGVERLGASAPQADLELILLGLAVLRALGLPAPTVRISHTGVVRALMERAGLDAEEQLALYERIREGDLDGLTAIEARLPDLPTPLRFLFQTDGDRAYVANVRAALADRVPEALAPLQELTTIAETLSALGEPYRVSMALARNFEYYTGLVFRFDVAETRVGGGGRYDRLLAQVSGHDVPASGFALEVDAIAPLLTAEAEDTGVAFVVRAATLEPALLARAHEVATVLRERGLVVALNGATGQVAEVIVEGADQLRLRQAGHESVFASMEKLADVVLDADGLAE